MKGYLPLILIIAGAAVMSDAVDPAGLLNLKIQAANFVANKASSVIQAKQNLIVNTAKGVLAAKQNFLQKQLPHLIEFKTNQVNSVLEVKKNFLKTKAAQLGQLHVTSQPVAQNEFAPPGPSGQYEPAAAPEVAFGPPPAPQPSYGPPSALQPSYAPPSAPQPVYGPPSAPQPSYRPPSAPQPSYGPPNLTHRQAARSTADVYVGAPAQFPSTIPQGSHQFTRQATSGIFPHHLEFATPPPPPRNSLAGKGYHL